MPIEADQPALYHAAAMKKTTLLIWLAAAFGFSGCNAVFRINAEDAQAIVNNRVVGTRLGDFIGRYGGPRVREEARDGAVAFNWDADFAYVGPGPRGTEERHCRLRISADRNGRIVAAPILQDGPGKRHLSRCAELFEPA